VSPLSSLKKLDPVKKKIELVGKGLLRTKIKEQKIRILQHHRSMDRIKKQLNTARTDKGNGEKYIATVDRYWTELESRMRAIVAQHPYAEAIPDLPEIPIPDPDEDPLALLLAEFSRTPVEEKNDECDTDGEDEPPAPPTAMTSAGDTLPSGIPWGPGHDAHANSRVKWTSEVLTNVLQLLKKQDEENRALAAKLASLTADEAGREATERANKSHDRLRTEVATLSKENASLRTSQKTAQSRLVDALGRVHWLENENFDIVSEYNHLLRNNQYLQDMMNEKEGEMAKKLAEAEKRAQESVQNARPEKKSQDEEPIDTELSNKILNARLEELADLQKQLAASEKNINFLKREKAELKASVDAFVNACYVKDSEALELHQAREQQSLALIKTRQQAKEQLERVRREKEELRKLLEKQKDSLQQDLQTIRIERDRLQHELDKRADYTRLRSMVQLFEEKNDEMTKRLQKLRDENVKICEEFGTRKLKEENERLKEKVDQLNLQKSKKWADSLPDGPGSAKAKEQLGKYVDLVKSLKAENKQLKVAHAKHKETISKDKTIQLLSQQLNKTAKQVGDSQARFDDKEKKYLQTLKDANNKNSKLMNQTATINVRLRRTNEEKTQLLQKLTRQNDVIKQQQLAMQNQKARHVNIQTKLGQITHAYNLSQSNCESWKREHDQSNQRVQNMTIKIKTKDQLVAEFQREVQIKTEDLRKTRNDYKRLEEKHARIKKYKGKDKDYNMEVLETQVELLQKKLRCSLCNNRENKLILGCSHMFCEPCITSLIKSRNRKCPKCMKNFNQNEIRTMYISADG